MTTVHFIVAGRNVWGEGNAKAGHDSIEVTGATGHHVAAYRDDVNMCQQLIGAEYIELGRPHEIRPHAATGDYEIRAARTRPGPELSGAEVSSNGKLHVGS